MVGALLWRGMLLGVLAGILCFGFLKLVGEAPVEGQLSSKHNTKRPRRQPVHTHIQARRQRRTNLKNWSAARHRPVSDCSSLSLFTALRSAGCSP